MNGKSSSSADGRKVHTTAEAPDMEHSKVDSSFESTQGGDRGVEMLLQPQSQLHQPQQGLGKSGISNANVGSTSPFLMNANMDTNETSQSVAISSSSLPPPVTQVDHQLSPLQGQVPLSEGSWRSPKDNDEITRRLLIALSVFVYLELICFVKFIFFPVAIIQLVGGPFIITIPWSIWALLNFSISFGILFFKANPNEPTLKSFYLKYYDDMRVKFRSIRPSNGSDLSFQSQGSPKSSFSSSSSSSLASAVSSPVYMIAPTEVPTPENNTNTLFEFKISNKEFIVCCVWFAIDILASIITLALALALTVLFVEPDQILRVGWTSAYNLCIAEVVFCALSIVCRIGFIIVVVLLNQRQSRSGCMKKDWKIFLIDSSHFYYKFRSILSIVLLVLSIVAFGFFIGSIHSFFTETYYRNHNLGETEYSNCDPLVPSACMLPFPSSLWLEDDASTVTGYKVNVGPDTLSYTKYNRHITVQSLNNYDGFSVSGAILWKLDREVPDSALISYQDIAKTTLLSSTTLIIDVFTQALFPHFSENDYLEADPLERIQYSVPAKSLDYDREYVVVVKGIQEKSGGLIEPSSMMSCYISKYLNNADNCVDSSDGRYTTYSNTIFPLIQTLGIPLSEVQLAWNFHTASESSLLGPLRALYNSTVQLAADARGQETGDGIDYRQTSFTQYDCDDDSGNPYKLAASVYFRINVPWYLDSFDPFNNFISSNVMNLTDPDDINKYIKIAGDVGLLIQVPCSVASSDLPPSVIIEAGHGIFGSRSQLHWGWLSTAAESNGWLMWAADWKGFSTTDIPILSRMMMFDGNVVKTLEDQVLQGFASKLYMKELIEIIIKREADVLKIPEAVRSIIATLPKRFIGVSMGGILGAGYSAFSKYSESVFLVTGAPFTFILGRSSLFAFYVRFMDLQYYSRTNIRIVTTSMQVFMDKVESSGWANSGAYSSTSHLLQVAEGDSTVTAIAARICALNLNASVIVPTVTDVFGVPALTSTLPANTQPGQNIFSESAYTGDQKNIPKTSELPTKRSFVHNCFPEQQETMEQYSYFLTQQVVVNPCEPSACEFDGYASC